MTREEYDALPGANFSTLKYLLLSGAHYKAALAQKEEETAEDKLRFAVGTLTHAMVLEGKNLLSLYAVKPEGMSFATKEGKAWRAEQTLPILDSESAIKIPRMAEAVAANPLARNIILRCPNREFPLQAEIDGVLCKGLLDLHGRDKAGIFTIPDYKTTTDAQDFAFRHKVQFQFHYDLQSELYKALARECDQGDCEPLWIVQETNPPYEVMVYSPSNDLRVSGQDKLQTVLSRYREYEASGKWPGYPNNNQINAL